MGKMTDKNYYRSTTCITVNVYPTHLKFQLKHSDIIICYALPVRVYENMILVKIMYVYGEHPGDGTR